MKVKIKILNAFINNASGGNPAGVVLNADKLTHNQKLTIASKVGLSETAFVSNSTQADYKLDFYTPELQIAHCGHATIAVFSYLAQIGEVSKGWYTKETVDGNRKILIEDDMAYMQQMAPKYTNIKNHHQAILTSLGISKQYLLNDPLLVNTGNSFVIVGVKDQKTLSELKPDFNAISSISEELDLIGYYIYCNQTIEKQSDVTTRMFFPRYGVDEEAATGMAAGPMACYLYDKIGQKKKNFNIEQGYFMSTPSPSKIEVNLELENEQIVSLMAGGTANVSNEIEIVV